MQQLKDGLPFEVRDRLPEQVELIRHNSERDFIRIYRL